MSNETESKKSTPKRIIFKFIILVIYLAVLVILYSLLTNFGTNIIVTITILVFVFLLSIGPFLKRRKKKSLYSRMFPDKK